MIVILKPLFEVLSGDVAVMDNVGYNYIIMLVVGEITYQLAFRMVGDMYRSGMINGRGAGSILHWLIRLLIYCGLAYLIRGGIWLYNFVIAVPHWMWWLIAGVAAAAVLLVAVVHYVKERGLAKNDGVYQKEN